MQTPLKLLAAASAASAMLLGGCSITQEITAFEETPQNMCIAEHEAVKEGVLEALQEGYRKHGVAARVIPASYELKHRAWHPEWDPESSAGCDAMTFYVANWAWDLALYMVFANIWITTPDGHTTLAQATYDASRGGARLGKFVKGHDKILELVDEMMAGL